DGVDASLLAGVPRCTFLRLRHSWDPIFPDDQIGQGRLKVLLGEFALARGRSGLVLESSWRAANIVRARLPIIGFVTCHRVVVAAATDALNEIAAAGLGGLINVSDTQRYGGCFNARELRTDTGTSGRNLSRHTWGGAIDINPSTNTFGGTPRIDQRIVQIFRDHGFIWGGSFSIPDGMHFEYIGERVVPTQCPDTPVVDAAAVVSPAAVGLHPLDAVRVVDTRIGLGGPQLPLRGGCVLPVDVSAAFAAVSFPAGVTPSAVTLNLTGTNAGARGFVTAYPCGMAVPTSSNLNVAPGSNWSNQVTVALGSGSRVCVASSVRTDLVVDVAGWYGSGGARFVPVVPERVADTRLSRVERAAGPVAAGSSLRIALGSRAPVGATAVAVTVTSAASDGDGYLTAYSCDAAVPGTSNVNHRADQIVANHAVVPLGSSRDVCVFGYVAGDVVVDVMGWYVGGSSSGAPMHSVTPTRLVDTRAEGSRPSVRLADGGELRVTVPASAGLSSSAITAATVNVTAVDPAGAGYLTVYPCGADLPTSSNVNYVAGSITAAQTTVGLGTGSGNVGQLCVRTYRAVDVVVDLLAVYG
ncbi:MAG: M15 family metallopeptidase, partial [Acidimicrobiia bacterium]